MESDLRDAQVEALARDLSSLERLFQMVREVGAAGDLDSRLVGRAELVVEELFTNLLKYNSEGTQAIEVTVGRDAERPEGMIIRLVDRGVHAFDPRQAPPADTESPLEERRPGGLGLHLVLHMVDSLDYHHQAGHSTTTVVLLPREDTESGHAEHRGT